MLGDQQDMLWRMKQVLPLRWFPDDTPVLDTALSGVAWAWAWVYSLLQTVRVQARISTATDIWLDLIATDYFGTSLGRRGDEMDSAYRQRIQRELIRERGTRAAVVSALGDLTGQSPALFEPANTSDTGGYGGAGETVTGLGYGSAGGWGNLNLPFQFFVTAYRPVGVGIAFVSGWNDGGGGYGEGTLEYASLTMMQTQVTDSDILSAITGVLPIGVIAWTRITS
ncbi:MAG TPA: hypothetical protein VMB73_27175 [Acetobacteraceae bacterium]|jgi:hypothetical protein|nr:hypothetical protein [Acetobacteraceae bacterium]